MHSAAPTPPGPQHLQALARANAVRLARATLKRGIAAGTVSVGDVVRQDPWEAGTMTVFDLLRSQRRWGDTRCKRLLRTVLLSETKTVGALTERQRGALGEALDAVAAPARLELALA